MKIKVRVDEEEKYVIVSAHVEYDGYGFCGTSRLYGNVKAQGAANLGLAKKAAIERMWEDVRHGLVRGLAATCLMVMKQSGNVEIEEE